MEYIFINQKPNYTIVTGLNQIIQGIEITPFELCK